MSDDVQPEPPSQHESVKVTFWPPTVRHRLRHALLGLLMLTLVFVLGAALHLRRYVAQSPQFCLSCHSHVKGEFKSHAHEHLSCNRCHRVDPTVGMQLWIASGTAKSTLHGQIDLTRCKDCHFDQRKSSTTAKSIGHQNHVTVRVGLTCGQCHGLKGHKTTVNPLSCSTCHDKVKVREHGMSQVACLLCHQFIKEGNAGDPGATGCPTCHSGSPPRPGQSLTATKTKPINATVVHGNVNACRLCHEPHRPDPMNRRHAGECTACHRRVVEQHIEANIPTHRNCAECHAVHGPRPKTPDLCVRCHDQQTPKPGDSTLAAKHQSCSGCHVAHTFRPNYARCIECHQPVRAVFLTWKSEPHTNCIDCHSGHSTRATATACIRCHQAKRNHGHDQCTTCHSPHQDRSFVKECIRCHQPEYLAVGNSPVSQHRSCSNCHATHAPAQAPARCAGCHVKQAELTVTAPSKPHQTCRSCHVPHQFTASDRSCRNCHRAADLGAHNDGCIKCHESHGAPGRPQLVCGNCHDTIGAGSGHHADCRTCHSVHRSDQSGPACALCHGATALAANNWKAPTHRDCATCHERHSDKAPQSCASCHVEKANQSLAQGHRCLGCHNPHKTPVLSVLLCASCHQQKAALVSGATPTHKDCMKCHSPHSNNLPTCLNCHQTRLGSHVVIGHQRCSACHQTHQVQFGGRDKCLACHSDKVTHYPKAATCIACHSFR